MFSNEKRCIYGHHQLAEVICQLRFPQILSISANAPVDFQEAIRDTFPIYKQLKEIAAPKLTGTPGNMTLGKQESTTNYQFTSADGAWKVNMTDKFISLACARYTRWEEFANHLDKPLAAFIQIYKPAFFERIGLRYVNFFSRKALSLDNIPYTDLFNSRYLGLLSDEELKEGCFSRCSIDADVAIRGGCRVKVHAGPGIVKRNGQQDKEIKFIFDQDLYMPGNIPVNLSAGALQTLHLQAYSIFRGAITDTMHEAMGPESIE